MSTTTRSRAWFPGRYFALNRLSGVEVIDGRRRGSVHVSETTLHGTPEQLRHIAAQLVRAAALAEAAS